MLDPRIIRAIRINALKEAVSPSAEYQLRAINRWYSREFYTPLHVVEEDLPREKVLQHYYETIYSSLNAKEKVIERRRLLETADERRLRRLQEEEAEIAEEDEISSILESEQRRKKQGQKLQESAKEAGEALKKIVEGRDVVGEPVTGQALPKQLPEEIHLSFDSSGLLEGE